MKTKSIDHRLKELSDSINAISFSVNNFLLSGGDDMHLLTIKTQLRALIATGGRNMKPLLLDLADKLEVDLILYTLKQIEPPPDDGQDGNSILVDIPWPKTWTTVATDMYEKVSFREWMLQPNYKGLDTNGYVNRNKILREIADTSGSHFDEEIRELIEYIDGMQNVVYNSQGVPVQLKGIPLFLLDLATATSWIGTRFFLKVNKEFHRIKDHDRHYEDMQLVNGPIRRMVLYGKVVTKDSIAE